MFKQCFSDTKAFVNRVNNNLANFYYSGLKVGSTSTFPSTTERMGKLTCDEYYKICEKYDRKLQINLD